jgi:hypothetical protein
MLMPGLVLGLVDQILAPPILEQSGSQMLQFPMEIRALLAAAIRQATARRPQVALTNPGKTRATILRRPGVS